MLSYKKSRYVGEKLFYLRTIEKIQSIEIYKVV